jgi:spore germination protein GerM
VVGDDGVLDLDLSDLGEAEGTMQRLAVAQLVLTLTDLEVPPIDAVRFSVDGHEVAVPMGAKVVPAGTPVRPGDDPDLATG